MYFNESYKFNLFICSLDQVIFSEKIHDSRKLLRSDVDEEALGHVIFKSP